MRALIVDDEPIARQVLREQLEEVAGMNPAEKTLYPLDDTDYAVSPGETLQELLEERGMSQRELARRLLLDEMRPGQLGQRRARLPEVHAGQARRGRGGDV